MQYEPLLCGVIIMKLYTKVIKDCTKCPNFEEDNDYDNNGLCNVDFICTVEWKKIGTAPKNEKGQFMNDTCTIPDW